MVEFGKTKISDNIIRIHGINNEQMYLITGKERAALIDTGSGVGNLKGLISEITDKPVVALITHGHVDHALGVSQFGEAYMNRLDRDIYLEHSTRQMQEWYLSSSPLFSKVTKDDYAPVWPFEKFNDLNDSDVFDLGGITVETFSCAGHSPGSMMLLIREERVLIAGDACAFFTMLQSESCLPIEVYERNLKALHERTHGRYDRVLVSHGRIDPPINMIEEVIDICREIREGTDDKIPYEVSDTKGCAAKAVGPGFMRLDGGYGNIFYNPDKIYR